MVIAYLRVSTGKQHPANQKEEIRKFAASKNLKIDQWVTEVVSGKKKEKERSLGSLMKKLKRGDILIVTELSRLSRTLTDLMSILGRCLENGIILYSTKDGYAFDNSINSKVLAFAFGLVAEIEHNLISLRTKEALALRKSMGIKLGRPSGSNVKIHYLEEHQSAITEMLDRGESIKKVCHYFGVSRDTFYKFKKKAAL